MKVRVLHRDAAWLALDKPAGLPTTAPESAGVTSLVDRAKTIAPLAAHHHPLSRLDVGVTGVVLFALSRKAIAAAERARAEGTYERAYVGALSRAPTPLEGRWELPIAVDPRDPTKRTTGPGAGQKPAVTEYVTLAVAPSGLAVARFRPRTGRTHQIRVHASASGCPLAGDVSYGGARRLVLDDGTVVEAPRVMLHAWRVVIPERGLAVLAPLPEDLRSLWRACGGGELALTSEG